MEPETIFALLHILYPDKQEEVVPLRKSTVDLGRTSPCDVLLSNQQVSRLHARLLFEVDRISVMDLNSSNGTFVRTSRLSPNVPTLISYGEEFRLGPLTLRLESVPQPSQDEVEPGPALPLPEPNVPRVPIGTIDMVPPTLPPSALPVSTNGDWKDGAVFGLSPDESRYLQFLPPIYAENKLLGRWLLGFEAVLLPIEQMVDNFDLYLDPATAPEYFLPQLATWLAMTLDEKWPVEKRCAVLAEAVELYRRRGTRWSLSRHIEIYTDVAPEISEPMDHPHHFEVVLRVPKDRDIDRVTIEKIIQANRPAHTTYSLKINSKTP